MKVYIRKIDNQCIEKQISYTKEILRDFLDNQGDHSTITCIGKNSKEQSQVALLLATDPRFDNSIQKILRAEGNLEIGDIMVMYKMSSQKYIVELVKSSDKKHSPLIELFDTNDRHLLAETDDLVVSKADTIDQNEQKERFRKWLVLQKKSNGELYSENTIYSYIHQMESAYEYFNKYKEYESVFQIQDLNELKEYVDYLYAEEGFEDFNLKAGNKAC
ncbi:MAG: hypothetical protein MJ212_05755, partial [Alphaproteobacteria bacterium]|nr:hypothetical protein [Alphaproteobacteria bacterium]